MKFKTTLTMMITLGMIIPSLMCAIPTQAVVPLSPPNWATLVLYENVNGTGSHPTYYNFTSYYQNINNTRSNLSSLVINQLAGNLTLKINSAFLVGSTWGMVTIWNNNRTINTEYTTGYVSDTPSNWGGAWRDVCFTYPLVYPYNVHGNFLNVSFNVYMQLQFPSFLCSLSVNFTNGIYIPPSPTPTPTPAQQTLSLGFTIAGGLFLIAGIISPIIATKMYKSKSINGVSAFVGILVVMPIFFGIGYYLLQNV